MSGLDAGGLEARLAAFRERSRVPALGGALVTAGAAPVIAAVGRRVRSHPTPVTADDSWHIGSCAKAMTAALAGRYVESGRLRWDTSVPDLFEDLAAHPGWEEITLTQLLTHRAGVRANLPLRSMRAAFADPRPLVEQRSAAAQAELGKAPGPVGRFRYSNLGYILAGAALERLGGEPYEQLVVNDLLEPLGATRVGFGAPAGDQPRGHRPRFLGMGRGGPADPGHGLPRPADNPPIMTPAGRLHMPLGDWVRFIRIFLLPGNGLLGADTIATLLAPAPGPGPSQAMGWAEAKLPGVGFGQQGSNRLWVATALVSDDRRAAALVVGNDGRTRLRKGTALLAASLLEER